MSISRGSLPADKRVLEDFVECNGGEHLRRLIDARVSSIALRKDVPPGVLRFLLAQALEPGFDQYKENAPEDLKHIFDEAKALMEQLPDVPADYTDVVKEALEIPGDDDRRDKMDNTPSEMNAAAGIFENEGGETHVVVEVTLWNDSGRDIASFEGTLFDLTFVSWSLLRTVKRHLRGTLSRFGVENLVTKEERQQIAKGLAVAEEQIEAIRQTLKIEK